MPLRIGLIGWGTMGSALGALVAAGPLAVELVRVGLRDPGRPRAMPLPPGIEAGSVADLLADDSLDAVVELTGGIDEPLEWSRATLRTGRAYVTGNKRPNPFVQHGVNLAGAAFLTVSLLVNMNPASLVLEFFWAAIAIWGLVKAMRERRV